MKEVGNHSRQINLENEVSFFSGRVVQSGPQLWKVLDM